MSVVGRLDAVSWSLGRGWNTPRFALLCVFGCWTAGEGIIGGLVEGGLTFSVFHHHDIWDNCERSEDHG